MELILNLSFDRKKSFYIICYCFMRLLRGALCTLLGAVTLWEYIGFRPLPELRPKSYRHSPFLLSLPQCQARPFWSHRNI